MFTQGDLDTLKRTVPFTAFRLHMSDGGYVDVISPETIIGQKRTVFVALDDDRWTILNYLHISRVELLKPSDPFASPPSEQSSPTSA